MLFVMNTVIMCQIHYLSMEMQRENLLTVPEDTPIDTYQA